MAKVSGVYLEDLISESIEKTSLDGQNIIKEIGKGEFNDCALIKNRLLTSAQFLMSSIPELAFSTKSACSSGKDTHSYVLKAIGLSDEQIENTIRMGISKYTTMEDIQTVVKRINEVVSRY